MTVILNILFPILIWLSIYFVAERIGFKSLKVYLILLSIVLGLLGLPVVFGIKYSNWILEYFSIPIFLTSIAVIVSVLFITISKKTRTVWFFLIAFLINIGIQGLCFFGESFGGGSYPSKYEPSPNWIIDNYYITEHWTQGFSGPKHRQFVVERPILNGILYKEFLRTTENDTSKCEIAFYTNSIREKYIFDRCNETFRQENN